MIVVFFFSFRSRFLLKLESKDKKQIYIWSSFSQDLYSSHTLFCKINEDLKKTKIFIIKTEFNFEIIAKCFYCGQQKTRFYLFSFFSGVYEKPLELHKG